MSVEPPNRRPAPGGLMRVPYIRVLGTISLVLLSACSKIAAVTGATTVAVASVVVTPPTSTIVSGTTAQFSAVTSDATGQQLTGRVVTWSTTNATVASVS